MRRIVLAGLILPLTMLAPSPLLYAQEDEAKPETKEAKDDAAEKADAKAEEEEPDPFAVPEGDVKELQAFISQVKRVPVRSVDQLKQKIDAVITASEKIIAAEPEADVEIAAIKEKLAALAALKRYDRSAAEREAEFLKSLADHENEDIQRLLKVSQLKQQAAGIVAMSEAQRSQLLEELFTIINQDGLSRDLYTVASSIAARIANQEPEAGAQVYLQLADAMEKSDDPALAERAERTRGSARRVQLPGNFMAIEGTTADGEPFDWDKYRGKVVLVDFWASWCGPCRREIPNMKDQLAKYGEKGFAIVGINLDNTREAYQKYVDEQELTWENLLSDKEGEQGWDHPLVTYYGVSGIPTAILVDKEGKVVTLSARGQTLNRHLEELLGPVEEETETEDDKAEESAES